ncbi:MAG: TetR/AcrR family transcriptional regulator [Chloroflexota bacterium]|nr:TetR/AcrR family transcriptional regulator [Chloroflexota bacterium]
MPRKYELKRRAERQEETRRRIVEATVELHRELGLARTTISAIAERAGVERLTVYRHFPDDVALLSACSARFAELHPLPNPAEWTVLTDPETRLRKALADIYTYYRGAEPMLTNVFHDAPHLAAMGDILDSWESYWRQVHEILLAGWGAPQGNEAALTATVGLAVDLGTWRALTQRQGLSDSDAASLMTHLVRCATGGPDNAPHLRELRETGDGHTP